MPDRVLANALLENGRSVFQKGTTQHERTRWRNHVKKQTVDASYKISVLKLSNHLRARTLKSMTYGWLCSGKLSGTARLTLDSREHVSPTAQLDYWANGIPERQTLPLELNTARNPVNGHWYVRCHCGRRCRCLYRPEKASRFACRLCHGLTYRSAQTHDKRLAEFVPLFRLYRVRSRADQSVKL